MVSHISRCLAGWFLTASLVAIAAWPPSTESILAAAESDYTEQAVHPELVVFAQNEELAEDIEYRAKGPVHEAFATPHDEPRPPVIVPQKPPEPIEELPPDQKPDGDNVVWIPGYWDWDDEEKQYIWVSGFWRAVPPGRVWVPGWWRETAEGWQRVPGFWQEVQDASAATGAAEIRYLPPPPATLEVGPTLPAPGPNYFYVPGVWVWRGRYLWRPGFWCEYRPGWVWIPDRYCWTPYGYVWVPGYWDYPLAARGTLFAPVIIRPRLWRRPAFVFTPTYVVCEPVLVGCLFVRPGWSCYFFGDYFAPRYVEAGFTAWCGRWGPRGGFRIGFSVGSGWRYDPLWSYYAIAYRHQPAWFDTLSFTYVGRLRGDVPRPPVTLTQQNIVINKIAQTNIRNVTNVVNVDNRRIVVNNVDVTKVTMLTPLPTAQKLQPDIRLQAMNAELRARQAEQARQLRQVAARRQQLEASLAKEAAEPKGGKRGSPPKDAPPIKEAKGPPQEKVQTLRLPPEVVRPATRRLPQLPAPPPPANAPQPKVPPGKGPLPKQKEPLTKNPLPKDPPGKGPLPKQKEPLTKSPLPKDPPGKGPLPKQKEPLTKSPRPTRQRTTTHKRARPGDVAERAGGTHRAEGATGGTAAAGLAGETAPPPRPAAGATPNKRNVDPAAG